MGFAKYMILKDMLLLVLASYYNLSSVMIFVCPLSPRPLMNLEAPNLAGRIGWGTKNTS